MTLRPAACALLLGSGCASNLATLQTAETTPKHHFEADVGMGAYLPTSPFVNTGKALLTEADPLTKASQGSDHPAITDEQKRKALDAALSIGLQTPDFNWQVGAKFGILDDWDAGLRFSMGTFSNVFGAETKYRFWDWHNENGQVRQGAAVSLRVTKVWLSNPALDVLDFVHLAEFSRYDLALDGLYTLDLREFIKLYGGPKYALTYLSGDGNLIALANFAADQASLPHVTEDTSFTMQYFGVVGGVALGYKRVFLLLELNSGYTLLRPTLFGQKRDLGGATFYPAIGLVGWI